MGEGENFDDKNFQGNIKLTQAAIEALDNLFDAVPPRELRENLLEIYHTYLIHAHHTLPLDFEPLARNMYHLTSCLLTVSHELSGN